MKLNTKFSVGQLIRFNYIYNIVNTDGRGQSWNVQASNRKIGKIVALHPENKKTLEVKFRDEDKVIRLHPRNVIQIIPVDCIPMTPEEKYQYLISKFYRNEATFKKLSPFARDFVMKRLEEIQECFESKLSYNDDCNGGEVF